MNRLAADAYLKQGHRRKFVYWIKVLFYVCSLCIYFIILWCWFRAVLEADFSQPLHSAFHYYNSSTDSIWLKYCWKDYKTASHPSIFWSSFRYITNLTYTFVQTGSDFKFGFFQRWRWSAVYVNAHLLYSKELLCTHPKTLFSRFGSGKPDKITIKSIDSDFSELIGFSQLQLSQVVMKILRYLHIFHENINCDPSLDPPQRGGSNERPQFMFNE